MWHKDYLGTKSFPAMNESDPIAAIAEVIVLPSSSECFIMALLEVQKKMDMVTEHMLVLRLSLSLCPHDPHLEKENPET